MISRQEEIYYNYKPIKKNRRTEWIPDKCECGSYRIKRITETKVEKKQDQDGELKGTLIIKHLCANCNKPIEVEKIIMKG